MSVKIKKVSINAFRGIPHLELGLDGKSMVIFGENGTGKSSIAEAVEFFLYRKNIPARGCKKTISAKARSACKFFYQGYGCRDNFHS